MTAHPVRGRVRTAAARTAVARTAVARTLPVLATVLTVAAAVLVPATLVPSLAAPTVVVNSSGDGGDTTPGDGTCSTGGTNALGAVECTLRAAIEEANAGAVDDIAFAVPADDTGNVGGIVTIVPGTDLPGLDLATTLDARTQPGWTGTPVVVLDGSASAGGGPGLRVTAGPTLVAGVAVHSFAGAGIEVALADDTTVRDSHVGVDGTGLAAPGNGGAGIVVDGARAQLLDNVVGGNAAQGIVLDQGVGGVVRGSWIGVGLDGVTALPNGAAGVEVGNASSATVGGTAAGQGNVIAGNGGAGVALRLADAPDGVAVVGNSLVANGGLGIDLGDDGVTPNDVGDGDVGPNRRLNTPEPLVATPGEVTFELDVPVGTYRIEVFRNPTEGADVLGSGEGEELVGSGSVEQLAVGATTHTVTGLVGVAADDVLTLTATVDLGAGDLGSTSELSAAITADDHLAVVNDGGDEPDLTPGDGVCDTGLPNAEAAPACTLRAALQEVEATTAVDTVEFAVPAADPAVDGGVLTVTPATSLPVLTAPVTVDGTTQPGFVNDPVVAVDGGLLAGDLLVLGGADSTVLSLALHGAGGDGFVLTGDGTTVAASTVGLLPDGTTEDGVGGAGIHVDGAVGVLVVDSEVVDSGLDGIAVTGTTADDVAVVGTTVRDSGDLGIDLGDDGVTPNDAGDLDVGPNGLANAPVVTAADFAGGTVTLALDLDRPTGDVLLQVFTAASPDPSGAGEGDVLVHSETVAHVLGSPVSLAFPGAAGSTYTLTATEDLGAGTYGATSEFSATATRPVAADDPGDVATLTAAAAPLSWFRLGGASGTPVVDEGSLATDGTTVGDPVRGVAGALAGDDDLAIELDGSDDVVVVPHDPAHLLAAGTVALWVRVDDLSVARVPFSKEAAGLGDGGHAELRIEPDGTVVHRLASTTTEVEVASAAGAVGTGTWHHLAATFGPRGTELWVDGVRAAADPYDGGWGTTSGGSGNTEPILLGASGAASGDGSTTPATDHLDGRLDEVVVLATQLDGAAVAALAGAGLQAPFEVDSGTGLAVPATTGVLVGDHDADGDALTAALVTGPASAASFALQPDGAFTYTGLPGFTGTDTFTYVAQDGVAASAPATVTVTVLPGRGDRVMTDATGNGHDGTPAGVMTSGDVVSGKVGGAVDLDGVDDRVEVRNLDVAGSELTISAWVDPDEIGTDPVVLAKAVGVADADVEWRLLLADTSATTANAAASVRTTSGLATAVDAGTTDVADGWRHVVARWDGSLVTLFVDGAPVATAAQTGVLRPDPTVLAAIGAAPDGSRAFDGRIDEVRVSHVARSDAWIAADHATQDAPAVTAGATQTSATTGWTTATDQARSGSSSALAPSGVLRSWLTLDGVDEVGLEAVAWWRTTTLTDLDLGQGVRAGDAAGTGPVRQDETGLDGATGWDLGQVDTGRTRLLPPPAGQAPAADTWQRVVVRIDQADGLAAEAAGTALPGSGTTPAGVAASGTVGFRVGLLDPATRWWIDDLRVRRYVTPEPVATLRRTELAP